MQRCHISPSMHENLIPIFFHQDGVPCYRNEALHIISWSSVLSQGDAWDSRNVIATLPSARTSDRTLRRLCQLIADDLQQCMNESRISPYKACFAGWLGDYEARALTHCERRYYRSNFVCMECSASKHIKDMYFTDFRMSALWRMTYPTSQEMYMRTTPPEELSPWCCVPGFEISRKFHDRAFA